MPDTTTWFDLNKPPVSQQPQGLLTPGNIDLYTRPHVKNPDGSISTVRSMSFGENGKEILVPTVGDEGRILSDQEAIQRYRQTGKHLGIFKNPEDATKFAINLHNEYANGKYDKNWFQQNAPSTSGLQEAQEPLGDKVINVLRNIIPPGLAGIAATAGSATPLGPFGGAAAGVGTYTATDLALKNLLSTPPKSTLEELKDTGTNAVVNEGGSALLRGLGGLLQKIPTVAKYTEAGKKLATQITGGRPSVDATDPYYLASNVKTDVENLAGQFQNPPAIFAKDGLKQLLKDEGTPQPVMNLVQGIIKDPAKLQRTLDAGALRIPGVGAAMSNNIRRDLAGFELTQLTRQGPSEALAALKDVNNKESYTKLFSQQTRANLEQLFKSGENAETLAKFGKKSQRAAMVFGAFGGLHVAASLFTGHLSGYGEAEAVLSGAVLTGAALAKVMSNTPLARGLTRIAEGTAAGMSDQTISRMLIGALQGSGAAIDLLTGDGKTIRGTINSEGQFQPEPSPSR